jgi:hypothetical protein
MKRFFKTLAALLMAIGLTVLTVTAQTAVAPITDPGVNAQGYDPWPTEQNAWNNSAVTARANASILNQSLLTVYQNNWNMWAGQVVGGYIDPAKVLPPQPPLAWVAVIPTSMGAVNGYAYVGLGTVAICALPPAPPSPPSVVVPVTGSVGVGIPVVGNPPWFTVLPTDAAACGFTTPANWKAADGTTGVFRRFCSPFGGSVGWYEKIG